MTSTQSNGWSVVKNLVKPICPICTKQSDKKMSPFLREALSPVKPVKQRYVRPRILTR